MYVDIPVCIMLAANAYYVFAPDFIEYPTDEDGNVKDNFAFYEDPIVTTFMGLWINLVSMLFGLFVINEESKQYDENFSDFFFHQMRGSFGWYPFHHRLEDADLVMKPLDFTKVECLSGKMTQKTAKVQLESFNFDNGTCIALSTNMLRLG